VVTRRRGEKRFHPNSYFARREKRFQEKRFRRRGSEEVDAVDSRPFLETFDKPLLTTVAENVLQSFDLGLACRRRLASKPWSRGVDVDQEEA
jgi:hypothetical protein